MEYLYFLIPVFLVVTWVLVMYIVYRIGWAKLAAVYSAGEHIGGTRLGIISLSINVISYNNGIILKYNEEGMYLKPIFLVRLFHKPLFIPWNEIKEVRDKTLHFFAYKEMTIGSPTVVKLGIRKKIFAKIENTFNYYSGKR